MKYPRLALVSFVSLVASVILPLASANAEVAYSAHFVYEKEPMKLIINRSPAGSTAQILAANGVLQARCSLTHVEKNDDDRPVAIDMDCRSAKFSPLVRQATVFWPSGVVATAPALRFGTWLEGYEQVRLNVDVDRYGDKVSSKISRAPSVFRYKPVKFNRIAQAN